MVNDPEDKISSGQYHSFYFHKPLEMWNSTRLDDMLESLMEKRKHIAIVKNVCYLGPDKDQLYEVVGEVLVCVDPLYEVVGKVFSV